MRAFAGSAVVLLNTGLQSKSRNARIFTLDGKTNYSQVVMVGNRLHDVEGAKAVGLTSIGVLFGYGSRQELEEAGADRIAESVEALYDIIMDM
ncbi:MAG TPA: HAD hydrolase-like protein [Mobilitalea sp.]|nr:HAD hydrolase-like protein [Mobilitalea sp.]